MNIICGVDFLKKQVDQEKAQDREAKECWFYWELHGQVYKQKQKMTECLGLVWVNV